MDSNSAAPSFYRPELDSLRFFAFLMVFMSHSHRFVPATFFSPRMAWAIGVTLGTGSWGVDLFFVLSAYLITELLRREKEATGKVHIGSFYARRVLRIWPLYFLAIGIGYLAQFVWTSQHLPTNYIVCFLLLGGNWICALHGIPHTVIGPLWSVSIEEQFYLSWPWVVRNLNLRWIRNLALLLLIVPTIARLYLGLHNYPPIMFWCNTFARLDPILAGILLSLGLRGRTFKLSYGTRVFLFIISSVCLVLANKTFRLERLETTTLRNAVLGYPLAALLVSAMFVSVLGAPQAGIRWTSLPFLRYLGRISYGLYVFHRLCYVIAESAFGSTRGLAHYFVIVLTAFGLTLILAATSYRFFERPFLRLKERFTYVLSDQAVCTMKQPEETNPALDVEVLDTERPDAVIGS